MPHSKWGRSLNLSNLIFIWHCPCTPTRMIGNLNLNLNSMMLAWIGINLNQIQNLRWWWWWRNKSWINTIKNLDSSGSSDFIMPEQEHRKKSERNYGSYAHSFPVEWPLKRVIPDQVTPWEGKQPKSTQVWIISYTSFIIYKTYIISSKVRPVWATKISLGSKSSKSVRSGPLQPWNLIRLNPQKRNAGADGGKESPKRNAEIS